MWQLLKDLIIKHIQNIIKMNVGILTFHRSINYGAFMQAYSLSNEIRTRFGDVVEIIDFELEKKHEAYKNLQSGIKSYVIYGGKYNKKYQKFQDDLSLLPLSSESLITNDYDKVFDYINGRYDIIIVGSDAIWAYNKSLGLKNPYWLFGDKLKCIKMSYAASAYSLDVRNVPQEDKDYIADCLKSFTYIGVRDAETYNFIKLTNPKFCVHYNCDPTVLLPKPDKNIAEKTLKHKGINLRKKLICEMIGYNKYIPLIEKILSKKEYEFINVHRRNLPTDCLKLCKNKFLGDLSPYEWYHIYGCMFLNFTNLFHGTLLGLKSNVPTFSFDSTKFSYEYLSKIRQVLTDMNLSEFWFDNNNKSKEQEDLVLSQVEYAVKNNDAIRQKIEQNMTKEQQKSESFFECLKSII